MGFVMNNCPRPTDLIGTSQPITELKGELDIVALSAAKVLITGESGVGKEVVARAIHDRNPRRTGAFVPVNCAGIPETLLESELFGHVKGSFTGAYRDQPGKLETAVGGTVFLDEIGEMSLRMQGVFLRFLETGEIQKVGAERARVAANVRIVAATNRDLMQQIANGEFREDLFYRLNVIRLVVPPLRHRREDIPLLVAHFLKSAIARSAASGASGTCVPIRVRGIAPDAMAVLRQYAWPGNVRQLENVIERLVVLGRRELVNVEDLPAEIHSSVDLRPERASAPHEGDVADELFRQLVETQESFWRVVYPRYMKREITRANVRSLVHRGLEEARGNYKIVLQMFNMDEREYKRFLDFLRKHDCQLPFKEYRTDRSKLSARA
jgi:transcriptional regulator with PAS, ATPase and Fis domain